MTSLFQTKTRFAIFLQSESLSQLQNRVLTRIYYPEVILSFTMTKKFIIAILENY
jgi:hypothetical protein